MTVSDFSSLLLAERIKTRAAHFPKKRNVRTGGMQRVTSGKFGHEATS